MQKWINILICIQATYIMYSRLLSSWDGRNSSGYAGWFRQPYSSSLWEIFRNHPSREGRFNQQHSLRAPGTKQGA